MLTPVESVHRSVLLLLLATSFAVAAADRDALASDTPSAGGTLLPEVEAYVQARVAEFDSIANERKQLLHKLAEFVAQQRAAGKPALLTFICTHNSRRSHLAQVWAAVAAAHYGVDRVETFSGGTEATAFNPRAVAALKRAGLAFDGTDEPDPAEANPRYSVRFGPKTRLPMVCFSKVYDQEPNPTADFCAVMTCTDADEACPTVAGAALRLAIPYEDPKAADGAPAESATYDARCAQIAREMLYAFSQVE